MKELLHKWLKKFFYLKLCYGRSASYFNLPSKWIKDFFLIAIFLKTFEITNYFLIAMFFIFAILFAFVFGHIEIKNRIAHIETSVNNQINPELMDILNSVNGGKKNGIKKS